MERPQLQVEIRSSTRKGPARRMRAAGSVPAVLYGPGTDAVMLGVSHRLLERLIDSNQLMDLIGDPSVEGRPVLIKEFQRDPVSQRLVHCDFYAVDTSRKLLVEVPVHFTGKAKGVELGGVLETLLREVEVRCLPTSIPSVLNADVTDLGVGDTLHAASIPLPPGVELVTDPELSIAHVIASRVATAGETEEGEAAAAEGAGATGA